jgi:L-ribulose-5-phosphate 3-epimerase
MLGVCSWSLRPTSPEQLAGTLARIGTSSVQLALDPIAQSEWSEIESFNRLAAAGITVASGMIGMRGEDYSTLETIARTGGVRLDEHWAFNLENAKRAARIAARRGVPLVTFHAGFIPHHAGPERDVMIRRLREIADVFDDRGVRVGFETGQESAETLLEALAELDRPHVGVNFDPANMLLYGMGDPIAALAKLAPRAVQVHIKDANATKTAGTWGEEVVVGTGQVAWDRFFATMRSAGLWGSVGMMIEREAGESREKDIAQAKAYVERVVER